MADTVVSMATSLVGSAISMASSAASQEMTMLIGVQNEIWFIKDELMTMQAFLRAAEARKERDELVKVWALQVRDLAYDIEDCLQEFVVHIGRQSLSRQLMKLRHRHQIAVQIQSLKLRVEEVSNRNMRYNLIKSVPSSTTDDSQSNIELTRYQAAHYVDEAELVGFDVPKKEILELVSSGGNAEAQTIWIVGAGGLGKTTLAKKVYESSEVSSKFPCRAWITVSQSFNVKDLLKNMIRQLLGEDSLKKLLEEYKEVMIKEHNLTDHLNKGLRGRRYFVVLDDLWSPEAWDYLKPNSWGNNMEGSQVVVTTRNKNLVGGSSTSLVYHLKPLEKEDARKLLLRKTKRSLHDIEKDQLNKIFENILNKCGGLPLAIITVGAALAGKDIKEWEILYTQLPSELESNPSLAAMRKVVALSYNYLPPHLKPCFLYLSIFPEDFEIRRKRLVHRWIAEGFVRARGGVRTVHVAEKYFNELINRSMIQASRVNIEGTIKSCRVHDIMRDVMISISREENFVYLMGDNGTSVVEQNIRHVVYHGSKYSNIDMDWSHVRSLTLFSDKRPKELSPSLCSPQLKMLRVLDLEDVKFGMTQKDMDKIGSLLHLKYVKISFSKVGPFNEFSSIYALPRSVGKLQGLHTLDISDTYITTLPTEISKLQSLRVLRCRRQGNYYRINPYVRKERLLFLTCLPLDMALNDSDGRSDLITELHKVCSNCWRMAGGVRVPRGIKNLKGLQELGRVNIKLTDSRAIEELGELSQLRKLSLVTQGSTEKKCKILCAAIEKLTSLESLYVNAEGGPAIGTLGWLDAISHPPPSLRSLRLGGFISEMPNWFRELKHLVKIYLYHSPLKVVKTMDILGELPNLMLLHLLLPHAYVAEKLVFIKGAFQNLRKLVIEGEYHEELEEMRFEEGTSPQMEWIGIHGCLLRSGIVGVKNLPRLKEIALTESVRVARLGQLEGEVGAHPNRPI